MQPVLRFAPSPNGLLHLGHALSAVTGFEMAKSLGGRFLVRMEDIDHTRVRPEFVQGVFDDLAWLGLTWEEPVLYQSQHLSDYKAAALRLADMGVTYPCFATRTEIAAAADPNLTDPDGALIYPGLWRGRDAREVAGRLERGEPYALRLDMQRAVALAKDKLKGERLTFEELSGGKHEVACAPERWGDVVILRKETPSSYLIAVVVDDARQRITHVTRGMDLFAATDVQRVLQVLLDLPQPMYCHHRLILGTDGQKLSKSTGARSLKALRNSGVSADEVKRMIAAA